MFRSVKASRFLLLGVLIVLLTLAYKIPNASASDLPRWGCAAGEGRMRILC